MQGSVNQMPIQNPSPWTWRGVLDHIDKLRKRRGIGLTSPTALNTQEAKTCGGVKKAKTSCKRGRSPLTEAIRGTRQQILKSLPALEEGTGTIIIRRERVGDTAESKFQIPRKSLRTKKKCGNLAEDPQVGKEGTVQP